MTLLIQIEEPLVLRTYQKPNCSSCSIKDKESFTKFYKEEIGKSILKFLKLERAPQVSREDLPTHLINRFAKTYHLNPEEMQPASHTDMMMGDAPSIDEIEDELESKSFKTNLVHVFSKNRKCDF